MNNSYNKCFVCGKDNPDGLQIKFTYPQEITMAKINLPEKFEGYPGIIHGGIVATLLDEAMAKIVIKKAGEAVTGRMNLEFKKYVKSNTDYLLSGSVDEDKGRILKCSARLVDLEGKVHARAEATFVRV